MTPVVSGVLGGLVTAALLGAIAFTWRNLRRPRLSFSTSQTHETRRLRSPAWDIVVTNSGWTTARDVMVSMLFSPELAVTAFDNNSRDGRYPLNPPRVEREGHLWASFEHQLERPLTRRAVYSLGTFIAQFPAAEVGRWPVYVTASLDGFSPVAATLYVDLQKPE